MSKHQISRLAGKALAGIMTAALLFTGLSTDVKAAQTGTVAVSSAIVRSDASTTADSVCTAGNGTEVTISEEKTDSSGNVWYHVTMSDGSEGYIRSDLLKVDESSAAADTDTADASADTADAADETAGDAAASTGNVVNGIDVTAISLPDGVTAQDYQQATISVDSGKVRSDASTGSDIVATLASGTNLVVAGSKMGEDSKTWYYVSFLNDGTQTTGYIRSDLISMGDVIVIQTEEPEQTEEAATEETVEETPANNDYELVYTDDGTGNDVWYLYNHIDNTREKLQELLDFADSQSEKQAESEASLQKMKIIIIVLAVLLVLTVIALVVVIIRSHSGDYEYEDDDDEDEDDDEEEEEEPVRRRDRRQSRRRRDEDDEDEDEEDEDEEEEEPVRRSRKSRSEEPAKRKAAEEPVRRSSRQTETSSRRSSSEDRAPRKAVRYEEEETVKPAVKKNTKAKNFMLDDDFEFEFLKLEEDDDR